MVYPKKLNKFLYFLKHPFLIYLFILPVYTTNRVLGEDLPNNLKLLPNLYGRIEYYVLIFVLSGIGNLLLLFLLKFLKRNDVDLLIKQRTYSLFIVLCFILTTYFMFFSMNYVFLLLASGVHFFCIAYLGNLAVIETKYYLDKSENVNVGRAINSATGTLMIDFLSIVAVFVLAGLYWDNDVKRYGIFCVALEISLFVYLLVFKKYYKAIAVFFHKKNSTIIFKELILFVMAIFVTMCFSLLLYKSYLVLVLLFMLSSICFFVLLRKIKTKNIALIISNNFSYSIFSIILMSSLPLFLLPVEIKYKDFYTNMILVEKFIAFLFALVFLFFVAKNKITIQKSFVIRQLFINASIVALLPVLLLAFSKASLIYILLPFFFLMYGIIETISQFVVRNVVMSFKEDNLTIYSQYFSRIIFQLLVPTLFLLIMIVFSYGSFLVYKNLLLTILLLSIIALLLSLFAINQTLKQ